MILFNKLYKATYNDISVSPDLIKITANKMNEQTSKAISRRLHLKPIISLSTVFLLMLCLTLTNYFAPSSNNFVLMVYASESNPDPLQGIDITKNQSTPLILKNEFDFASWDDLSDYAEVYTDFQFQCIGENIDSVTFSTASGEFTEKVILTRDQLDSSYRNKLVGLKKVLYPDNADQGIGYIHLGQNYTVAYDEQTSKQYGFKFDIPKDEARAGIDNQTFSNTIFVTTTFKNGHHLSKTVQLNYNGSEIYFIEK